VPSAFSQHSDVLKILQLTDTHLYGTPEGRLAGMDTHASLQDVIALAQAQHWPPDLILATGDLAQDGSPAAYKRLQTIFESLAVPIYHLPGNHDIPAVMQEVLAGDLVQTGRHYLRAPWQIILLDSTVPDEVGGHLPAKELDFLDQCLQSYPELYALICVHHQPVPVGNCWMDEIGLDNSDSFFAVLDHYPQAKGVLWGHVHQHFEQERKGVRLLATPSTCIQFKPGTAKFTLDTTSPGYRWLELGPTGYIYTGVCRVDQAQSVDFTTKGY
jgi:3',5'-cyclic-AMP phosphodiesterase